MLDILGAVLHFASEPVGCRVGLKPSATPAHLNALKVHIPQWPSWHKSIRDTDFQRSGLSKLAGANSGSLEPESEQQEQQQEQEQYEW